MMAIRVRPLNFLCGKHGHFPRHKISLEQPLKSQYLCQFCWRAIRVDRIFAAGGHFGGGYLASYKTHNILNGLPKFLSPI
jgi:hypothetical protein